MFGLFKSAGENIGESIGEAAAKSALRRFVEIMHEKGHYIAHEREIRPECLAEVKRRNLAARPR